jgi:hypothetical protein
LKVCVGCLNNINDSPHTTTADNWNYKDCTQLEPTDAYGKLSFPGSTRKNAHVSLAIGRRASTIRLIFKIFSLLFQVYSARSRDKAK